MTWRSNAGGRGAAPARPAGFTLIETIVVIAVLGLALSVVASFVPRNHAALDLNTAADSVAEALRDARARAIAAQRDVTVAAAGQGHAYSVDSAVKPLPADVTLTAAAPVRFAPDGSASGGTLRLDAGARSRVLRIDWLTGQVSAADAP